MGKDRNWTEETLEFSETGVYRLGVFYRDYMPHWAYRLLLREWIQGVN